MSDVQKAWEEVDSHDHLKKNSINFPGKKDIFNSKVQQQQQKTIVRGFPKGKNITE